MAAITRLGFFGFGVKRAGSFLRLFVVAPVDLANVVAADALVTRLATVDALVGRVATADALVTKVTATEWPV